VKLVTITDPYNYSRYTVARSYEALAGRLGWEHQPLEVGDVQARRIEPDSRPGVFVFETALIKIGRMSVAEMRGYFPSCRAVALGGDTIWYMKGGDHHGRRDLLWDPANGMEFLSPYDCDLFLDLLDEVVEAYAAKGIRTDSWMWTTSGWMLDEMAARLAAGAPPKDRGFVALFKLDCEGGPLRRDMLGTLEMAGLTGVKSGQVGWGLDELFHAYARSELTVGTTSPSWTRVRTMKGFRDWMGPEVGSLLLYDDHPDVVRKFPCPLYPYGDHRALAELALSLRSGPERESWLKRQQEWANVIENQLYDALTKHGLVRREGDAHVV